MFNIYNNFEYCWRFKFTARQVDAQYEGRGMIESSLYVERLKSYVFSYFPQMSSV